MHVIPARPRASSLPAALPLATALAVCVLTGTRAADDAAASVNGSAPPQRAPCADPALVARLGGGFIANLGQWQHDARFVLHHGAMTLFVEDRGWVVDLVAPPLRRSGRRAAADSDTVRAAALRMSFTGAGAARLVAEDEIDRTLGYALARAPERWRADVPRYAAVRFAGLYPGIDVRLREVDGHPEYDVLLEPGAELAAVAVRVEGADGLRLARDGALVIDTALGAVTQPLPRTWQVARGGERQEVACRYVLQGPDRFGFAASGRDATLPLTIDPGLLWSAVVAGTPVTGALLIEPLDVALDASGVVTIAGVTAEPSFPATMGAYDISHNGRNDAFVARFDPSLDGEAQLVWATFLGGAGGERAVGVALGADGTVTVAGFTASLDFPTTPDAYDTTANGRADVFVSKLDPNQLEVQQLLYSTYLGASGLDTCADVHIDAAGVITVTGDTQSAEFPTTPEAFDPEFSGGTPAFPTDSFLARLDPSQPGAAQLVYATFFGGTGLEFATAMHVDANGVVTIGGETSSADFPFSPEAFDPVYDDQSDVFAIRLDPSQAGSAQLLYGTLLGGTLLDLPWDIAVEANGVITLCGGTSSPEFSTTAGALRTTYGGGGADGFITQLDPSQQGAAQLVYSTFVGGAAGDSVTAVEVGSDGIITGAGDTLSVDFPTVRGAYRETFIGGDGDAFVLRIDPTKTGSAQLYYATFLGGTRVSGGRGIDSANALVIDPLGFATVVGTTDAADYPITPGAYGAGATGGVDAFLTRLDLLPTGVQVYGVSSPGCTGLLGVSVTSIPSIGNGAFGILCSSAPPLSGGILLLSVAPLIPPVPVLGIELWVDIAFSPHFAIAVASDAKGASKVPIPIPAIPTLQGTLYAQFLWLGPTEPAPCPPAGLSASNALQIDIKPPPPPPPP